MTDLPRPVVLCVLEGVGERKQRDGNAVKLANTAALDELASSHPTAVLAASGPAVGLPAGQVGSSEVGFLTLGAGRPLQHERRRIDDLIAAGKLGRNEMVDQTVRICLYDDCPLHLLGLLSHSGVHSSMDHLYALIDLAAFHEIPVIVHAILDGQEARPRCAIDAIRQLQTHMEGKTAKIGTISGRYYAMDRDGRWDRTYKAFHAIVRDKVLGPTAPREETPFDVLRLAYGKGLTDALIEPTRIDDYSGLNGDFMCDFAAKEPVWEWTGLDVGLAFNFRSDRMRQLSGMLARKGIPEDVQSDLLMDRHHPVLAFREHCYVTMTSYGDDLEVPVVMAKQVVGASFGELLSRAGLKQLRCAESESRSQVTRCFNGGREQPFDGEDRRIIASSKLVDSYDDKPEMKAKAVANAVVESVRCGQHDFILVALSNPDAVSHTGKLEATIAAIEAVDEAVGRIAAAVREAGGVLAVTSSHGNSELLTSDSGDPHAAHTDNPVPFIYVNEQMPDARLRESGGLQDVAPTLLELLGLQQPVEMTGKSLLISPQAADADSSGDTD